jgi:hypothetical protein
VKISIVLAALTGSFETDMNRASKTAQKRMKEIEKTAKEVGKVVGAALSAAATASALAVKAAIDRADELSKAAQKIGVTTEALSALSYAADLADVELSELQAGLGRLTKFQAEAAEGNEDNIALLKALGIEYQNLDGSLRDTGEVFRDLSTVFAGLPDGAEKTALALEVFGRAGANLIPLLNEGAIGLDEMRERAEELGLVLSTEAGKQAEEFNDRLTELQGAATGLATAVALELLPDLNELVESFADGTTEGDKFAGTAENIANGLRGVAWLAGKVYDAIRFVVLGLTSMAAEAARVMPFVNMTSVGQNLADLRDVTGAGAMDAGSDFLGLGGPAAKPSFDWAEAEAAGQALADEAKAGNEAAAALKKLREERANEKDVAAAAAEAKRRAAEAEREAARIAAEAERERQKVLDAGADAAADLTATIERNAATLAGPAAEAARAYADEMVRLVGEQEKLAAANLLTADAEQQLALAREQAAEKYQRQLDDIEKQRTEAYDNLMSDIAFELKLLGLTNLEREKEIALRYANVDAASAEGQAIAAAIEELDRAREVAEGMDVVRDATQGLFQDLMDGSKSAKEAFMDFVDSILAGIAQIVARNLTESLLGSFGSTGGGKSGNFLADLFGSFFGGARAGGGDMYGGKAYLVGEQGPELVIPKSAGTVIPAGQTAAMLGGRATVIQNFNMPGRYDLRTQAQVAADAGRSTQRALARGTA